jgi:hypothetical protein
VSGDAVEAVWAEAQTPTLKVGPTAGGYNAEDNRLRLAVCNRI